MGVKVERLKQMSVHQVVRRGCQEASKRWDRVTAWAALSALAVRGKQWGVDLRGSPAGGRHGMVPASLDSEGFFEGAAHTRTTAALVARTPESREIISSADEICQGCFDLLGYRGLDFGDPVDWHLDPCAGRSVPPVHWSRLDPLDSQVVGDSKVIWELNRHQWLLRLGQAYQFTGDERYAAAFSR